MHMSKILLLLSIPCILHCSQNEQKESSTTYTSVPVAKAILEAMQYLHVKTAEELQPVNEEQKNFIERYLSKVGIAKLNVFSARELWAHASEDLGELNRMLKAEGFDIHLENNGDADFGVVAILKTVIEWKKKAHKTRILHNSEFYAAIELKREKHECQVTHVEGYPHAIASVKTKSNDTVYFAIADEAVEGVELQDKATDLLQRVQAKKAQASRSLYDGVVVPMVDLNINNNIDWLLGLILKNSQYISQAKQQTKFAMDEKGARVESAAAVAVSRGCSAPKPMYVIDKPFFVWIVREGEEPYFAAHVMPSDWNVPAKA